MLKKIVKIIRLIKLKNFPYRYFEQIWSSEITNSKMGPKKKIPELFPLLQPNPWPDTLQKNVQSGLDATQKNVFSLISWLGAFKKDIFNGTH